MFPGINPKKMQALMKQMGISQNEIPANRVIIETSEKDIIIENPSVIKMNIQGQENFQISGETYEKEIEEDNYDEDIKTLMEKTNCTKEEAKKALENSGGDLTEALLNFE